MTELSEGKFQNLLDACPRWVKESANNKCLIQLFVSFFDVNNAQAMGEINRCYDKFGLKCPAFLRVIELHDLKLAALNSSFAKPRNGVLHWFHKLEEKKIEPGVYVILGAPFKSDQTSSNVTEADARAALSAFSAIISVLYGFSSLHSKTCEFTVDIPSGSKLEISSTVMEHPAFFRIDHAKDIPIAQTFQISKQIADSPEKVKDIIAVTSAYLDRAIRELNHGIRLSLYISAIEALTGEASANSLCKMLGVSHQALRGMGYNKLLDRRTLFVH